MSHGNARNIAHRNRFRRRFRRVGDQPDTRKRCRADKYFGKKCIHRVLQILALAQGLLTEATAMGGRVSRRSGTVLEGALYSDLYCLKVSWIFSECDIVASVREGPHSAFHSAFVGASLRPN